MHFLLVVMGVVTMAIAVVAIKTVRDARSYFWWPTELTPDREWALSREERVYRDRFISVGPRILVPMLCITPIVIGCVVSGLSGNLEELVLVVSFCLNAFDGALLLWMQHDARVIGRYQRTMNTPMVPYEGTFSKE